MVKTLSFYEKKKISKELANPASIETYRQLLTRCNSRLAGARDSNRDALAVTMVYELLSFMAPDEIEAACRKEAVQAPAAAPVGNTVKKKFQNTSSIPASTGKTWTACKSGLQTLSSRIASTCSTAFQRLKKKPKE